MWYIYLVQLDDVRVPEQLEVLNLPPDLPDDVEGLDLLPVQDLDSHLVAGHLVEADCKKGRQKTFDQAQVPRMESRDNKNKLQKQDPFQGGVTYARRTSAAVGAAAAATAAVGATTTTTIKAAAGGGGQTARARAT